MKVVVIGLGIQGKKRLAVAGPDVSATVDPVQPGATFTSITPVPLDTFDAALVCTPDAAKLELLGYLLGHGKHVLVEKPLVASDESALETLAALAKRQAVVCYTAYNHRFEPSFVRMKALLDSGRLGRIYRCRLFYGNGTARDVRGSWRDHHFRVISCGRFENAAFDHVVLGSDGEPSLELEMTLLSPRNHFTCDVLAEHGSAHIESLCKWGSATFVHRRRKLPSGRPDEEAVTLVQPDPTWQLEYEHFTALCEGGEGNIANDLWINRELSRLSADALG